jgi:hypothetical protein
MAQFLAVEKQIVMLASFIKYVFYAAIEWRSNILDGDLAMMIPSNDRYYSRWPLWCISRLINMCYI